MTMTAQTLAIVAGVNAVLHQNVLSVVLFASICFWLFAEERNLLHLEQHDRPSSEYPDQWNEDRL